MSQVNFVWLLWAAYADGDTFVEEVFIDKVLAEKALRFFENDVKLNTGAIYWLQERVVFHE